MHLIKTQLVLKSKIFMLKKKNFLHIFKLPKYFVLYTPPLVNIDVKKYDTARLHFLRITWCLVANTKRLSSSLTSS